MLWVQSSAQVKFFTNETFINTPQYIWALDPQQNAKWAVGKLDSVLALHPEVPGSILGIPKYFSLGAAVLALASWPRDRVFDVSSFPTFRSHSVAEIGWRHELEEWTEAW